MKKFLVSLICHNLLVLPAFCAVNNTVAKSSTKPKQASTTVQSSKKSVTESAIPAKVQRNVIVDDFAEKNTAKNIINKPTIDLNEQIPDCSKSDYTQRIKRNVSANKAEQIPVEIRIKSPFTTRSRNIDEGDYIEFETLKPVKIKNKSYPKGSTVRARLETISQNKSWGVPADLVIGTFSLDDIELSGEISKTGANRSVWVYPLIYLTTPFFCAGLVFIPIRGGHAKVRLKETFTVYADK